jgi:hypothetical protein
MNLYIIRGILHDYYSGMAIFKANTLEDVREMFCKKFIILYAADADDIVSDYDQAIYDKKYTILKLAEDDPHPEGFVDAIWGSS